MLLKLIVTIPTLAVSSMFSSSCEIQDPYIGPGGFGAKSIKVIGGDNVDVNCIVGQFEDEDFVYIIVDQECDGSLPITFTASKTTGSSRSSPRGAVPDCNPSWPMAQVFWVTL